MPLQPGDITIVSINDKPIKDRAGKYCDGVEITIRVRDRVTKLICIPKLGYTRGMAQAEIERVAADEIALLEKYS